MISTCPRCQIRIMTDNQNTDYVHECNSGIKSLDEEDVIVIGNWNDYTGSAIITAQTLKNLGNINTVWGTRAWVEGEKIDMYSERGKPKSVYRQRQHLEYIDMNKQKKR